MDRSVGRFEEARWLTPSCHQEPALIVSHRADLAGGDHPTASAFTMS